MSQASYVHLSKYFNSCHAVAVFGDGTDKMKYGKSANVALYTSDKERIMKFVEQFRLKKEIGQP